MNKPELYQKTVDILVQAYFNDTLRHDDCAACAVGNIIADALGYKITSTKAKWQCDDGEVSPNWINVFCTYYTPSGRKVTSFDLAAYEEGAANEIDATNYTVHELADMEKAFEMASTEGDYMFNGLMAVIEVLDQIHENTDTELTATTKSRFNKTQSVQ